MVVPPQIFDLASDMWEPLSEAECKDRDVRFVSSVCPSQVRSGIWKTWDENQDGFVAENEWNDLWFEGTNASFDTWDTDSDGILTQDEYMRVWDETDLYATWDADADTLLTRAEFSTGVWQAWNVDDDPYLTQNEWAL